VRMRKWKTRTRTRRKPGTKTSAVRYLSIYLRRSIYIPIQVSRMYLSICSWPAFGRESTCVCPLQQLATGAGGDFNEREVAMIRMPKKLLQTVTSVPGEIQVGPFETEFQGCLRSNYDAGPGLGLSESTPNASSD
jgi:hypothetical protein